jgi:hypothetical protein
LPNANRFGDLRRSTLSWRRRTRISASNAARDRKCSRSICKDRSSGASISRWRSAFWVCGRDRCSLACQKRLELVRSISAISRNAPQLAHQTRSAAPRCGFCYHYALPRSLSARGSSWTGHDWVAQQLLSCKAGNQTYSLASLNALSVTSLSEMKLPTNSSRGICEVASKIRILSSASA